MSDIGSSYSLTDDQVRSLAAGAAPEPPDTPDTRFKLPGGLLGPDGALHRDVTVREITGEDEEAMYKALRSSTNSVEPVDVIINRCVESIGTVELSSGYVHDLFSGDRAALVLFIRRMTFGDDFPMEINDCPECGKKTEGIDLDLSSVPWKKGWTGSSTFEHTTKRGQKLLFRIANGGDEYAVQQMESPTLPEANTVLLTRCLQQVDGVSVYDLPYDPDELIRQLSIADRREILNTMNNRQPGPDWWEVKLSCSFCGHQLPTAIDSASLLLG